MKDWFKALFEETWFRTWGILSALSTVSTFFWQNLSGKWRTASVISMLFGFVWANYRVFQRQERRLLALNTKLTAQPNRTSSLRIATDNGSRYVLVPANGAVPHGDFSAMFVEFHLRIENVGMRNSTVDNYVVEIEELRRCFPDLRPEESRSAIRGRHCQYALNPATELSSTGVIKIDAEQSTNRGTLCFFLSGVGLEQFANAGLQMHGEHRKFGTLHCRLTLTDTTGSSVTEEFQMDEA